MIFKNSVRNAKKTQLLTIAKINKLMLFREIIAVCRENNMKPIYIYTQWKITYCWSRWDKQLPVGFKGSIWMLLAIVGLRIPILSGTEVIVLCLFGFIQEGFVDSDSKAPAVNRMFNAVQSRRNWSKFHRPNNEGNKCLETSVDFFDTTLRNKPEDSHLQACNICKCVFHWHVHSTIEAIVNRYLSLCRFSWESKHL
jgi:hypothetical protein